LQCVGSPVRARNMRARSDPERERERERENSLSEAGCEEVRTFSVCETITFSVFFAATASFFNRSEQSGRAIFSAQMS